jgi:tRNA-Thr(GGU) m(6)t(6)A37 methyltransferase TsaA
MGDTQFRVVPVGIIKKKDDQSLIEIYAPFEKALLGLDGFSHIFVLYWFDQNDRPAQRNTLQIHPRHDRRNPLTGVFATHSPFRPNLIALSLCKIVRISHLSILVDEIDARNDSPVIDIKPYIPFDKLKGGQVAVPDWV